MCRCGGCRCQRWWSCGLWGRAGEGEQAGPQRLRAVGVGGHHQDGVVPGDRAEQLRHGAAVQGRGQERRGTRWGADHDEVARRLGGDQQVGGEPGQPGAALPDRRTRSGRRVPALPGQRVDQSPARPADLHGAELVQVPGQGRLGHRDPLGGQQVRQLGLAAHGPGVEHVGDPLPPSRRGGHDLRGARPVLPMPRGGDHPDPAAGHADLRSGAGFRSRKDSRAFCAWSRFSAWSQTAPAGSSMTSASISLPR